MEKFIETPNLPNNNVSLVVVDGRIPKSMEEELYKKEIRIIKTEKVESLYNAISYHPDIIMSHLGNNKIVIARNSPQKFIYKLENEGFNIIEGKNEVKGKYPLDVLFNVCISGESIICNEKYTDRILLEEIYKTNKKVINVKQGYAKCSLAIIDNEVFVTSDKGIHTILIRENKETLLISPKFISLFDMNYGFIGGASGKISSKEVIFFGDLLLHKDGKRIKNFIERKGNKIVMLGKNKLMDLGTLIPLKEYNYINDLNFPE